MKRNAQPREKGPQPQKRFTVELRRTIMRTVECDSREELDQIIPKGYYEDATWDNALDVEVVAWCEGCRVPLHEEDERLRTSDDVTLCATCGKDHPIDGFIELDDEDFAE